MRREGQANKEEGESKWGRRGKQIRRKEKANEEGGASKREGKGKDG